MILMKSVRMFLIGRVSVEIPRVILRKAMSM